MASFAPLTMFSGSSQLTTVLDNADEIGVAILATVLVAKMFTVMLSMSSGFIGGNVFPAIFLGGTAGALIHVLFPEVPYALAVAAMMAAVPGAFLQAPLTLIIIAVITVGVSPANLPAIAIAVVVSEETGDVSICHSGQIERDLDQETFRRRLGELLEVEEHEKSQTTISDEGLITSNPSMTTKLTEG